MGAQHVRVEFIQELVNPKQARVLRNLCEWDDGRFGDLSGVRKSLSGSCRPRGFSRVVRDFKYGYE